MNLPWYSPCAASSRWSFSTSAPVSPYRSVGPCTGFGGGEALGERLALGDGLGEGGAEDREALGEGEGDADAEGEGEGEALGEADAEAEADGDALPGPGDADREGPAGAVLATGGAADGTPSSIVSSPPDEAGNAHSASAVPATPIKVAAATISGTTPWKARWAPFLLLGAPPLLPGRPGPPGAPGPPTPAGEAWAAGTAGTAGTRAVPDAYGPPAGPCGHGCCPGATGMP
ncbi:hypothetical protein Sxan_72600 [Streptomyces xanthophaeus]|uniref:Uncharacterized protein n=1 Tax=Streptomyces xanthophaeus TaxID=67385 RepID=A0A919H3X2_9ACTN|nr:hypothetical protein Sxan_72600 [Streptomyces xanthophaeus]